MEGVGGVVTWVVVGGTVLVAASYAAIWVWYRFWPWDES